MKKILFTAAMVAFATSAHAAGNTASDSASAEAKIVKPISVAKSQDMDFGSFIVTGTNSTVMAKSFGGSTTLRKSDNTTVQVADSGITRMSPSHEAKFTVDAEEGYNFDIAIPPSVRLTGSNSGTMDFTPAVLGLWSIFDSSLPSSYEIPVYGVANVSNTMPSGTYSGSFSMTVQYQ